MASVLAFSLLAMAGNPPPEEWDFFAFLPVVSAPPRPLRTLFLPSLRCDDCVHAPIPTPTSTPTSTPTPTPTPSFDFTHVGIHGVNMQAVTPSGGLTQFAQTDATWIRTRELRWADVEPEAGVRNWAAAASLETDLLATASAGYSAILVVSATPGWAQQIPGIECGPIRADALDDFGRFMADAVTRYSEPPYNVLFWEAWNEPDVSPTLVSPTSAFGCWGDEADAYYGGRYYGEMLAAIYPRMKLANPAVQVMVGGLLMDCDPGLCTSKTSKFMEGVLMGHGGDFFDGISFHAYDYYYGEAGKYLNAGWHSTWDGNGPVLVKKARYLVQLMADYGVSGKFLADTELALLCPFNCDNVFEETKAAYLVQAYAAALAEDLVGNIWYDMRGSWRSSGLLFSDLTPRPAFRAFQFSAEMLNDADYVGEIPPSPGVAGAIFAQPTGALWLVWSRDGAAHTLELPREPAMIYDMIGNTLPVSTTLPVGIMPVYVGFGE